MWVTVNGEEITIKGLLSLSDLLKQLGYQEKSVAVARNEEHVPRHRFDETCLIDVDSFEILSPMQGG